MNMSGFDKERLERLRAVMTGHAEKDRVGGAVWLAARRRHPRRHGRHPDPRRTRTDRRDSVFRIASMTKPIVSVAALLLVEDCLLRLEDPVDDLLPELADRRVLVDGRGPIGGDTVPAHRPITVHDVLTFRLGLGMDLEAPWPQPLLTAMDELELGAGPPAPAVPPPPDEWMRRLSTLPLLYQPGERWLYNTGADVLGVLIARAAGQPLDEFLHGRVFEPLGMVDTGVLDRRRGPPRLLLRLEPHDRRAFRVRSASRSVVEAAGIPFRRRRSGVHARRHARVRTDAARRRSTARTGRVCSRWRRSTR